MKHIYSTLGLGLLLSVANTAAMTTRETMLIEHVKKSILQAYHKSSQLPDKVLAIKGMTSPRIKHLLNNLCTLPGNRYLEIGTWKGATFVSALYGNKQSIQEAIAIDNWSEFGGPEAEFKENCNNFIRDVPFKFCQEDSFKVDINNLFRGLVDIYFYDGYHSTRAQEQAFTYYNDIFAPSFIAIVDDWNCIEAQEGTRSAFEKLGYTVLFECTLPALYNGDCENWWDGLYIAVIRK